MADIPEDALREDINEHYQNPEFNEFDEGIAVAEVDQRRRILVKNLPEGLTRHAIRNNILGQFGEVVSMYIPESLVKNGFQWVFAEFSKFAEAERAIHELNNLKIDKNVIQAMFAFDKKKNYQEVVTDEEAMAKPQVDLLKNEDEQPEPLPLPITVDFNLPDDDEHEKVTDFFRKKTELEYRSLRMLAELKEKAKQSKGTYDPDNGILVYNGELFDDGSPLCCHCKRMALLRCEETGRYFCSIKCNKEMKYPVSKEEAPLQRNEIVFGKPLQVKDEVFISAIINEKCVYVKRMEEDCKMLNDFLKATKNKQKLEATPEVDDLVLIRFMDDFHRAKVLKVEENFISVHLYDIGNTARVSYDDLFVMNKNCQRIPCVAHKVLLTNVNCGLVNAKIIFFLGELLQSRTTLTITQLDGNHAVLVDKAASVNVNNQIEAMSKVEDATHDSHFVTIEDDALKTLDIDLIPDGQNQRLFVLNSKISRDFPGVIACISEENHKDFIQLYKAINAYATNRGCADNGLPQRHGVIFLAFCNDQWHRAILTKSAGDGAPLCVLIDLYSQQKIKVKDIIPMPDIFGEPPVLTKLCKIVNYKKDEELKEVIEGLENSWIMADEIKNGNDGDCVITLSLLSKPQEEESDGSSQRAL